MQNTFEDVARIRSARISVVDARGENHLARLFGWLSRVDRNAHGRSALGLDRREAILIDVALPKGLSDAFAADTNVVGSGRICV